MNKENSRFLLCFNLPRKNKFKKFPLKHSHVNNLLKDLLKSKPTQSILINKFDFCHEVYISTHDEKDKIEQDFNRIKYNLFNNACYDFLNNICDVNVYIKFYLFEEKLYEITNE